MFAQKEAEREVVVSGLTGFFDLLAQFDYEDHKKLSGIEPGSSASAPEKPGLVSAKNPLSYGAENQKK